MNMKANTTVYVPDHIINNSFILKLLSFLADVSRTIEATFLKVAVNILDNIIINPDG